MNVSLTPELETMIAEKVRSGLYHSASEVVREGLRLLMQEDELKRLKLGIAAGVEELSVGRRIPGEDVRAEIRSKSRRARGV
jgi:antitoxin ParD1/3/4